MDMGSVSSGNGIPPLSEFPKIFFGLIGGLVAVAAIANLITIILYRQRLSAARNGLPTPSKPKSFFFRAFATTTAIMREFTSASMDPIRIWRFNIALPTVGRVALLTAYMIVLVVLCFVGFSDTLAQASMEDIGYRTGFVCIAQIPLLFLLAGKRNIIGFLTGLSYERMNWMHRWAARCLALTTTIHFGYWLGDWWPYGAFVGRKLTTDPITYRGLVAWCFLMWMVISSVAPIRGWSYEFFVVQHLVSFALFIGFVYIHTPAEVHIYIWIPVGLYFFDRVVRAGYVLYTNISFFHPKQRREGTMKGLWACKAELTPLSHNTTKITLRNPPVSWQPGQHVFVSCHSVLPLQSHPFTISSIPQDGKMEFFVKAEKGATRRLFAHAEKKHNLPMTVDQSVELRTVAIEGPYGRIRPMRQFDSVILFAGSTGATFTMPLLRDIVAGWRNPTAQSSWLNPAGVVTRHVRFVWVVKSKGQLSWFASHLSQVISDAASLRSEGLAIDVEMSVYCTCDESFTEEHKMLLSAFESSSKEKGLVRGNVQEDVQPISTTSEKDVLKRGDEDGFSVQEKSSETSSMVAKPATKSCGPNGECCCQTVLDEDDPTASNAAPCCCGAQAVPEADGNAGKAAIRTSGMSDSTDSPSVVDKMILHPSIHVFAGRPTTRNIIRKSLEQARGESAVVVCGPEGLVDDVRNSVVRLSDERAVHKGTGAQGIYLHCECFKY
ncbi:ferric reductase [Tothia fuscella]|uniref:ferric-chelate reductase (NADPH) n=1 Tax=Tothia fuscella TaxID=1048955 RepID=A0A9P4NF04_9PEZI|nr:ferric reductase [Tothia fuscella]